MNTEELLDYLEWAVNNEVPLEEMCLWTGESSQRISSNIMSLRIKGRLKPKFYDGKYYCIHCGKYVDAKGFYGGKLKGRSNPLGLQNKCIDCYKKRVKEKQPKEQSKKELFGETRVCTSCSKEKDIESFHWENRAKKRLCTQCKECINKKTKENTIKRLKERGY